MRQRLTTRHAGFQAGGRHDSARGSGSGSDDEGAGLDEEGGLLGVLFGVGVSAQEGDGRTMRGLIVLKV